MVPSYDPPRRSPESHRDHALVARARAGDQDAVREFAERMRFVPRFLQTVAQRTGQRIPEHDMADLAQEISVKIWQKLESFEGRSTLETWVARFCILELRNYGRSAYRRRLRHVALPESGKVLETPSEGEVCVDAWPSLWASVEELGDSTAEVIRLHHEDDFTFEAIGRLLGRPASSIKSLYYRGLRKLQERLARKEGDLR